MYQGSPLDDGSQTPSPETTLQPTSSTETMLELYRRMLVIRGFEKRAGRLYRDGKVPGFVHLAIGQEAAAVGACFHLTDRDIITSTHRGHGHNLAKGLSPFEMFAELMGKEAGVSHGRGGSLHIADPRKGVFGANGIVGGGLPIAGGAAFAAQLKESGAVVVGFLGDGAISTGAFHETATLASLWKLPLIFFCENNGFSEFSSTEDQHPVSIQDRAKGYGLQYRGVDGNDVVATASLMQEIVEDLRTGGHPYLVEAKTLRHGGHYEGDPQLYRSDSDEIVANDPLGITRAMLKSSGVEDSVVEELAVRTEAELDTAMTKALNSAFPSTDDLTRGMMVAREAPPAPKLEPLDQDHGGETWKLFQAVGSALEHELESDERVFLAGIDVGKGGNVFALTRGLQARWPDRVRDTPILETAITGLAVGSAMSGLRPVIEIMYFDFIGVAFDQIMNQAAKLPYMTGGRAEMGLTIRTQFGAGRSSGAQHSQSLEALLAHIPGLTVVMPSTPSDAYGLLRASIQDPNPVIFVENRLQYGSKGPKCPPDHIVPIGQAAIRRVGTDLTIVSYSRMSVVAVEAAEELVSHGISAEVIDLRTIAPLDMAPILESVAKTNKLLIAHEASRDFGVGAEIAARMADEGIWYLDAPIVRVGAAHIPAPYSPVLEQEWLPSKSKIVAEALRLVAI